VLIGRRMPRNAFGRPKHLFLPDDMPAAEFVFLYGDPGLPVDFLPDYGL